MNFRGQLFNDNGNMKALEDIEIEDTHKIYLLQTIDALPKLWKDVILKDKGNANKNYF